MMELRIRDDAIASSIPGYQPSFPVPHNYKPVRKIGVINRDQVAQALRYPLTTRRQVDILQFGPGWREEMQFDQLKRRDFIRLLGGAAAVVGMLTHPRCCAADRPADMQCARAPGNRAIL